MITKEKKQKLLLLGLFVVAVILVVLVIKMNSRPDPKELQSGVEYLTSMEEKDIDAVSEKVQKTQGEMRKKAIESGELTVWELFASYNYIVMGDSRAVGFSTYEFLDEARVLADGGETILNIPDYMETLESVKPEVLFLCYGLNDVGNTAFDTPEKWIETWDQTINMLHEKLPDTQIIISSILPANEAACEDWAGFKVVPDYNEALKAYCEEHEYAYVDNDQIIEEHQDLYNEDGIHMQITFYDYWAVNLLAEVTDS